MRFRATVSEGQGSGRELKGGQSKLQAERDVRRLGYGAADRIIGWVTR